MIALCAGCGPGQQGAQAPEIPRAALQVSVVDGATGVDPTSAVTVRAVSGTLDSVTVVSADGKRTVTGTHAEDGTWTSHGTIVPKTQYMVSATAHNEAGEETTSTTAFTTKAPTKEIGYLVTPDGWTVGAGMPVQVTFDAPISSPQARAEIEKKMQISVTPAQDGAWGWANHSALMYRPKTYWASGTAITVSAPLAGTQVAPGTYLMEDNGATLTIGAQRVLKVDLAAHQLALVENGTPVGTFPISGGRPGPRWETRGGTKVITEKHADIVMDSSTFGVDKADPEYYRTKVQWAMRITNSGEFLHSAPWSVAQQGYANVSHGCVNLSPTNASWLFQRAQIGDIVETTGSSIPLNPGDAGVPVWLYSWPQWQARTAIPAPTSSPTASTPTASTPTAGTAAASTPTEHTPAASTPAPSAGRQSTAAVVGHASLSPTPAR